MNPLILFDYVFYRISYFYANVFQYEASKELNGITGLSFFQNLNLFTVLKLFDLRVNNDKLYVISFFLGIILFFGLNYIRYIKNNKYSELNDIWNTRNGFNKIIRDILVVLYCFASIVLIVVI